MTPLTQFLAQVRERLAKATPGPWRAVRNNAMGETWFNIFTRGDEQVLAMIGDCADKVKEDPNATLIAHAPTDISKALALIEVMREALEQSCICGEFSYINGVTCPACKARAKCAEIVGEDRPKSGE